MKSFIALVFAFSSFGTFAQSSVQVREYKAILSLISATKVLNKAYSSCNQASDCRAIAYGAKACGGPRGFLNVTTRNKNFSEISYLAERTELKEEAYNMKYEVNSDCSVEIEPDFFTCENNRCKAQFN